MVRKKVRSQKSKREAVMLLAILSLGGGLGANLLSPEMVDHLYVCESNEKLAYFESTPSSDCNYVQIEKYAKQHGTTVEELIVKERNVASGVRYTCSSSGCVLA